MTNTYSHAERELDLLEKTVPDAIISPFKKEILALCEAFGKSGQSGGSAPFVAEAISQAVKSLMLQNPICPITGHESEWVNMSEDDGIVWYQNHRCSAVFKENEDGKPYYLDAIVWQGEEEWDSFTGTVYKDEVNFEQISSRQYVKLPFEPKTFYLDVKRVFITEEEAKSKKINYIKDYDICYYSVLKDPKQLDAVFEYYEFYPVEK